MNIFAFSVSPEFGTMLIRFLITLVVDWIIVDRLYYPKSQRRDFYFTFILFSIAIFFLVFFMIFELEDLKTKTSIGIGIGLFGIFSILRYRTDALPIREMTYLFVTVALSVVNAIAANVTLTELLLTNAIFVVAILLCEKCLKFKPCKLIQYDRMELVKPEKRQELIADLETRLGLKVKRVDVGGIDMLRDMAVLKVYYEDAPDSPSNDVDQKLKLKPEQMDKTQE